LIVRVLWAVTQCLLVLCGVTYLTWIVATFHILNWWSTTLEDRSQFTYLPAYLLIILCSFIELNIWLSQVEVILISATSSLFCTAPLSYANPLWYDMIMMKKHWRYSFNMKCQRQILHIHWSQHVRGNIRSYRLTT